MTAPHSEDRIEEAARQLDEYARFGANRPVVVAILQRLYDDGGSYWKHKHDNLERYAVQLREDYAKLRAERDAAYDDGKKAGAEERDCAVCKARGEYGG